MDLSLEDDIERFSFVGWMVSRVGFSVFAGSEVAEGKWPFPFNNQYSSTSGNSDRTLRTKSKLGLFLPDRICEMLDLWTPIFSAKEEADSP